jgi:hypothetical protein
MQFTTPVLRFSSPTIRTCHKTTFHSGWNTNFACCITKSKLSCEERPMFSILTNCAAACVRARDRTAVPDTRTTCGSGFLVSFVVSIVMWHVTSMWMYLMIVMPRESLICQKPKEQSANEELRNWYH